MRLELHRNKKRYNSIIKNYIMSLELKILRKQKRQSIKNLDYYLVFSRFDIYEELRYYEEIENFNEIEAQIIELKLS